MAKKKQGPLTQEEFEEFTSLFQEVVAVEGAHMVFVGGVLSLSYHYGDCFTDVAESVLSAANRYKVCYHQNREYTGTIVGIKDDSFKHNANFKELVDYINSNNLEAGVRRAATRLSNKLKAADEKTEQSVGEGILEAVTRAT